MDLSWRPLICYNFVSVTLFWSQWEGILMEKCFLDVCGEKSRSSFSNQTNITLSCYCNIATMCIRDLDLSLVTEARWLFYVYFWPLLKWVTFWGNLGSLKNRLETTIKLSDEVSCIFLQLTIKLIFDHVVLQQRKVLHVR